MAAALATGRAGFSTPPEAVADGIVHAATAARPRTRYPVGSSARALLLRLLPTGCSTA